ncbi:MAG: Fe(3+) ABC transporter substrate-binding protein [Paenibacillaceae bacterium ZCTH02-B3]|nr:MAG: Fe(3+) ABC transporter substrate-binding protein [Paenibacillaceae bacterium ZCTH02-B3]
MKPRKALMAILAGFLLAGLLAACGSGANNGGSGSVSAGGPSADAGGAQTGGQEENRSGGQQGEPVVNIYSARHYEVDDVLFQQFTDATGIKVNVVKGEAEELIERLKREGASTEADLFFTVDGGVLAYAKESGVLEPVTSPVIEENVPARYRDKDNHWIGVSTRARVIVYSKDRVDPSQLSAYEDLADPKWKGKVLARSSSSLYNVSLLASFIALKGEEASEEWAKGVVANFARDPQGGDRDQAKAIVAGIGDVAIMNTYYIGLLAHSKDPEEVKVAERVGIIFPNQETDGTHINISGIGFVKHGKHKDNAVKLIEFLTGKEAQETLTNSNFEFPVNPAAERAEYIRAWGEFKEQELDFDLLHVHNAKAIEIFNKAGWK